jgi:signal transduction histidine kinase
MENPSDRARSELLALALGSRDEFRTWLTDLLGSWSIETCRDVNGLLGRARDGEACLIVVSAEEIPVGVDGLLSLLGEAAPRVPVFVVEAADGGAVIRAASSDVSPGLVDASGATVEQAIAASVERFSIWDTQQRALTSTIGRLRELETWAATTESQIGQLVHDLRTPAAIVHGYCTNLLDGLNGELTAEQAHVIDRMRTATAALVELLEGTRFPARPQTDAPSMERRTARRTQLDLAELCGEVVALFESTAAERRVTLTLRCESAKGIWGDRFRLKQAMTNLVGNALRFTPAGGTVEVGVRPAGDRGTPRPEREYALFVKDSGPGVPPEDEQKIFEEGWTSDAETGHRGLGLAICQAVAREHRGTLTVESAPGEGATFRLVIPADPRARSRPLRLHLLPGSRSMLDLIRGLQERVATIGVVEEPRELVELVEALVGAGGTIVVAGPEADQVRPALVALGIT